MRCLILVAALAAAAHAQDTFIEDDVQFVCPESYGDYEDPEFCDYFWRCNRGKAEPMECEPGHAYDPRLRGNIYPCDYVFNVNCTGRELLQDPVQGADPECVNLHGIYADPDLCGVYYVCKDGYATRTNCASGLHFNIETRECLWPEAAGRGDCEAREKLGNFSCPLDAPRALDALGNPLTNPTYLHPEDCRLFYICLNGLTPQLGGCQAGLVFNDVTQKCDDPVNVPGCENYYEPLEDELV